MLTTTSEWLMADGRDGVERQGFRRDSASLKSLNRTHYSVSTDMNSTESPTTSQCM